MAQHAARKPRPWWQQATALVTVSTGGVITGLNFAPGTPATMTDPGGLPLHLLALEMSANGGLGGTSSGTVADAQSRDAALRTAIVNIAQRYLNLAKTRSSAEMEALIWGGVSTDGADHGPSCAAFASLTLELGAQLVGQQSWVTGGDTYPWPIHEWAEPRVDANPASLAVTSIVQDAQRHDRWHPVGGGYSPQPGDWVLFDEHVEVVTSYRDGELHTIGANSLPGYTVNAHTLTGSLAGDGVQGFVDNGHLAVTRTPAPATSTPAHEPAPAATPAAGQSGSAQSAPSTPPARPTRAASPAASQPPAATRPPAAGGANIPGVTPAAQPQVRPQPRASRPPSPRPTAPQATPSQPAARPQAPQAAPSGAASSQAVRPRTAAPQATGAQPTARIPGVGAPQVTSAQAEPAPQAAGGQHASSQPEARIPGTPAAGNPAAGRPKASHARTARPTVRRPHARATASQADIPGLMPPGNPAAPTGATPPAHGAPAHTGPARNVPARTAPARTAPATPTPAPTTRPSPKPYARHSAPPSATPPGTTPQAAFIGAVAPGAMAAQQRWGVPAAVTIAQAIEESAWGQSSLAASYHNLFGIKGSGPAGSVSLPTQEFEGGQWVTVDAPFRVYHNDAESISDHAQLLATSSYYTHAMTDRSFPDAFANDLTGVYATDPHYGANLIALMKLYNLYQYDVASAPAHPAPTHPAPTHPAPAPTASSSPSHQPSPVPSGTSAPTATPPATPAPTVTPAPAATPTPTAASSSPQGQPRIPGAGPVSGSAQGARPARPARPRAAATTAAPRRTAAARSAAIPGLPGAGTTASYGTDASYGAPASYGLPPGPVTSTPAASGTQTMAFVARSRPAPARVAPRPTRARPERIYDRDLPDAVRTAFFASARTPIARAEPMYKDIANQAGISWKLLAACDWMQCQAQPHLSPVHGERLGTLNADGTVYSTKSAALAQCATDLVELAVAVYGIDLTVPRRMSISALANVFAAFRWGGLLRKHQVSSLEFPYSVEGLTEGHMKMRWPVIDEPNAPDRPGARFRAPFGAVPVVLSLNYRAVV